MRFIVLVGLVAFAIGAGLASVFMARGAEGAFGYAVAGLIALFTAGVLAGERGGKR